MAYPPAQVAVNPPTGVAAQDLEVIASPVPRKIAPQGFKSPQRSKTPRRLLRILPAVVPRAATYNLITTVPENTLWLIRWAHFRYTATATVGTRDVQLLLAPDDLGSTPFTQQLAVWGTRHLAPTASQTAGFYVSAYGVQDTIARLDTIGELEILNALITPGHAFYFTDFAAIDAGDTMTATLWIEEYALPRGLARGEIPLGLESANVMAEPSEVRMVA